MAIDNATCEMSFSELIILMLCTLTSVAVVDSMLRDVDSIKCLKVNLNSVTRSRSAPQLSFTGLKERPFRNQF